MRNLHIPTFQIAGLVLASSPLQPVAEAQDRGYVVRSQRLKVIIEVPVLVVVPQTVEAEYGRKEILHDCFGLPRGDPGCISEANSTI